MTLMTLKSPYFLAAPL